MSAPAEDALGGPAEEARRLVEALADWASARLGTAEHHLATGSAECQVCPVCQLIAALRGDRPEVLARLGEAWTAFIGVLTNHAHPPAPGSDPDAGLEPEAASEPPVRPVQNIDVR